jgi:CheY-specific phosphatase CheX
MEMEFLIKNMREAISNVMETMFFQVVQVPDVNGTLEEWFFGSRTLLGATLTFKGHLAGSIVLLMPKKMADEMTRDFLGLEKEKVSEGQRRDIVKEALNMIGGHALSISDGTGAYQIGIPALLDERGLTREKFGELEGESILIETENSRLAVSIVLENSEADSGKDNEK